MLVNEEGLVRYTSDPKKQSQEQIYAVSSFRIPTGVGKAFKVTTGHSGDPFIVAEPQMSLLCPALSLKAKPELDKGSSPSRPAVSQNIQPPTVWSIEHKCERKIKTIKLQ